ncbi:hypothetical protein KR059_004972 [Drosophila kikkawai]|nr:hypothetical protein KR059_004972 [Drosophila kikkawai]
MEPLAVGLAALFQLLGLAVFFDQPQDYCSPAPTLASWIFLVATLCFLWDTDIYPCRFRHMSHGWQILIEIVAAVFLVELSSIIVWCGLERCLYSLLEELFNVTGSERCVPFALASWLKRLVVGSSCCKRAWLFYWLSGLITSSASLAALWYVLQATEGMYFLKRMLRNLYQNVRLTWRMMRCYFAMSMTGRRRTLQVCQLANKKRCGRRSSRRRADNDDDDCDSD